MYSQYLDDLPQYHFEREDFVKVFREVFTSDEIFDIEVMCQGIKNTEKFLLYYAQDEFYIIHLASGTIINYYNINNFYHETLRSNQYLQ